MRYRLIRGIITLSAVILTAKLGRIQFDGHDETWYSLPMNRVVARADAIYGLTDAYAVREDGIKTYNGFVIVAARYDLHPYGSLVETSRGLGIVLDTGAFAAYEPDTIDIAVNW